MLYRIAKSKYIRDLSGEGARLYGGRWNRPGVPVLYTSETRSLAVLELLVHFNAVAALKQRYSVVCLSLDKKHIYDPENLQKENLFQMSNNAEFWDMTEYYFNEKNVLAIRVPSALIHQEYNVLLNPLHDAFDELQVLGYENKVFDQRFGNLYSQ
ncbi:MAG: RES family NAD+ phosphorylase [Saprospiraceae bacterium]|nr:RES family NAD+ phosphorylase [Saprospiraceae bacterium]